jgi:hypothetical protein
VIASDRYNVRMQNAFLEFRGSFQYPSQDAVDRALCEARDHLDEADISDVDSEWMRYLWRSGMTLHVEAILPETADRFVAAAILGALSRQAVGGRVEVTRLNQCLDTFELEYAVDKDVA